MWPQCNPPQSLSEEKGESKHSWRATDRQEVKYSSHASRIGGRIKQNSVEMGKGPGVWISHVYCHLMILMLLLNDKFSITCPTVLCVVAHHNQTICARSVVLTESSSRRTANTRQNIVCKASSSGFPQHSPSGLYS